MTAHSEVFKRMLLTETKEAKEKHIIITDFKVPAIEAFIRWLYLGEIQSDDVADALYALGDKYLIDILKVSLFVIR